MKRKLILSLAVILSLIFGGCKTAEKEYSATQILLNTAVTITLQSGGNHAVLQDCFALCRKYEQLFSTTIPGSDIERINTSNGTPVEVSAETAELLRLACAYSKASNGIFDLTVYPAKSLWDFGAEQPRLPDTEQLTAAVKTIDYTHVLLEKNTVTVTGGSQIDLGGIAKGFIADRLRDYLTEKKVTCAIINLGGNVSCVGTKPGGFRIGVKEPYTANGVLKTIQIGSGSVVTSGCYERYFTLNGKEYHHILNTKTGYPVENDLAGVTIVCADSVLADFLSTAVYAMGYENGKNFLKDQPAEAVFVFRDHSVRLSDGLMYTDKDHITINSNTSVLANLISP